MGRQPPPPGAQVLYCSRVRNLPEECLFAILPALESLAQRPVLHERYKEQSKPAARPPEPVKEKLRRSGGGRLGGEGNLAGTTRS